MEDNRSKIDQINHDDQMISGCKRGQMNSKVQSNERSQFHFCDFSESCRVGILGDDKINFKGYLQTVCMSNCMGHSSVLMTINQTPIPAHITIASSQFQTSCSWILCRFSLKKNCNTCFQAKQFIPFSFFDARGLAISSTEGVSFSAVVDSH